MFSSLSYPMFLCTVNCRTRPRCCDHPLHGTDAPCYPQALPGGCMTAGSPCWQMLTATVGVILLPGHHTLLHNCLQEGSEPERNILCTWMPLSAPTYPHFVTARWSAAWLPLVWAANNLIPSFEAPHFSKFLFCFLSKAFSATRVIFQELVICLWVTHPRVALVVNVMHTHCFQLNHFCFSVGIWFRGFTSNWKEQSTVIGIHLQAATANKTSLWHSSAWTLPTPASYNSLQTPKNENIEEFWDTTTTQSDNITPNKDL